MFSSSRNSSLLNTSTLRQSILSEQILTDSPSYVVKVKNSPVSVQVQEVLRNEGSSTSLRLYSSGWACLVSQQRAYLWRYSVGQSTTSCYQLLLPVNSSVNEWTARLVDVVIGDSGNIDGIVAGSPSGIIRYWKSLHKDNTFKDLTIDIDSNDSIHSLSSLQRANGFIATTNKGSLYLLRYLPNQDTLSILSMVPPKNLISGFSRRVSSFFFSSGSTDKPLQEVVKLLTWYSIDRDYDVVVMLTTTHIQCWKVYSALEYDQTMLVEYNVSSLILEDAKKLEWYEPQNKDQCKVHLLDMELTSEGLVILFGLIDQSCLPLVIKYGLILFATFLDFIPLSCDQIIDLHYQNHYQEEYKHHLLNISLQACQSTSQILLYNDHNVLPLDLQMIGDNLSFIDDHFSHPNAIIGSGIYEGELLLFTLLQGVVSVVAQSPVESPPKRIKPSKYLPRGPVVSQYSKTPSATLMEEDMTQLQQSFMLYLNNKWPEAKSLCSKLFPSSSFIPNIDTPGDLASIRMSQMILNEVPSADPRWGGPNDVGSVIIINQLKDKQEAHRSFIRFLTDMGLFDLLTCVTIRGGVMLTRHVLCEHAEKIASSVVLKTNQNRYVDDVIKKVVQGRVDSTHIRPGLSAQDIFYSELTNIDEIFQGLVDYLNATTIEPNVDNLLMIIDIASVIKLMLGEALHYRNMHEKIYVGCNASHGEEPEYLPWTASDGGSFGTREIIRRLLFMMLECWSGCRDKPLSDSDQQMFWNVYGELVVIMFTGISDLLESIKKRDDQQRELEVEDYFENHKKEFIQSILDYNQFQVSLQLAEKFNHFPTLIQVCEEQNSIELLKKYFAKYQSKGFGDHLFKHCLDNGKKKQLLSYSSIFPEPLTQFLSSHPDLLWIHYLTIKDYSKASNVLSGLSSEEERFLAKKKTMLSMNKLLLLTQKSSFEVDSELELINRELKKVEIQEQISNDVLEGAGFDPMQAPPFPPETVIEFLLSDEDAATIMENHLLALEYLSLSFSDLHEDTIKELKTFIWCSSILKTNWSGLDINNPLEELDTTFLFQLITESHRNGFNLTSLLPSIDELLSSSRLVDEGMSRDNVFIYFIKTCYEQLHKL
jgi:nuclear pore complex protein Nup133